jgi:hypothetical protein
MVYSTRYIQETTTGTAKYNRSSSFTILRMPHFLFSCINQGCRDGQLWHQDESLQRCPVTVAQREASHQLPARVRHLLLLLALLRQLCIGLEYSHFHDPRDDTCASIQPPHPLIRARTQLSGLPRRTAGGGPSRGSASRSGTNSCPS